MHIEYDRDALVTAATGARALGISRQVIAMWKRDGKVTPAKHRGRSPLYRLGDLIDANTAALAQHRYCHRYAAPAA